MLCSAAPAARMPPTCSPAVPRSRGDLEAPSLQVQPQLTPLQQGSHAGESEGCECEVGMDYMGSWDRATEMCLESVGRCSGMYRSRSDSPGDKPCTCGVKIRVKLEELRDSRYVTHCFLFSSKARCHSVVHCSLVCPCCAACGSFPCHSLLLAAVARPWEVFAAIGEW